MALAVSIYVSRRSFYDAIRLHEVRDKNNQQLMAKILFEEVERIVGLLEERHERLFVFDSDLVDEKWQGGFDRADMREVSRTALRIETYLSYRLVVDSAIFLTAPWGLQSTKFLAKVDFWNVVTSERLESVNYRTREELISMADELLQAARLLMSKLLASYKG